MPLLRKSNLKDQYSSSDDKFENNLKINDGDLIGADDDLLAGLDDMDMSYVESTEEIMAALDASDANDTRHYPVPVAPVADWLVEVRALARKHGPFSAAQITQIVHELEVTAREASR